MGKLSCKIVAFSKMSVIPLELLNKTFLCKVASCPSHQPTVETISPTQGCGDLDVDNTKTKFFTDFWIPSAFRKLLDKKDPAHVQEKKLCCVKASHVVFLYKVLSEFSLFQYEKKINKFKSTILGECYFGPFFVHPHFRSDFEFFL